jgi:hypothetical protein
VHKDEEKGKLASVGEQQLSSNRFSGPSLTVVHRLEDLRIRGESDSLREKEKMTRELGNVKRRRRNEMDSGRVIPRKGTLRSLAFAIGLITQFLVDRADS